MSNILNTQKLLESNFIERLTGFLQSYSELFGSEKRNIIEECIAKKDYNTIGFFLKSSSNQPIMPFSSREFITMDIPTIMFWKENIIKKCTYIDEKKSLEEEFYSFYE